MSARRQPRTGPRKTARRTAYHHGDLPQALIAAARRLLATRGPDAFTLRETARVVGVNHAAAYRHFADKRALLAAVAEESFRALAERMRAAAARVPADDVALRLERMLVAGVRTALDNPAVFRLMFGPRLNEDGRFPALERALDTAVRPVLGEVEHGLAAGALRGGSATDLTLGLLMLMKGYVDFVLTRRVRVRPARMADYFATVLAPYLAGMGSPRR
jgi:AcrR family transcriptional regulator